MVHCAANRFPDKVDKDPEGTRKLNVEATRDLARLCARRDIFLVYISTDCEHCPLPGPSVCRSNIETCLRGWSATEPLSRGSRDSTRFAVSLTRRLGRCFPWKAW